VLGELHLRGEGEARRITGGERREVVVEEPVQELPRALDVRPTSGVHPARRLSRSSGVRGRSARGASRRAPSGLPHCAAGGAGASRTPRAVRLVEGRGVVLTAARCEGEDEWEGE